MKNIAFIFASFVTISLCAMENDANKKNVFLRLLDTITHDYESYGAQEIVEKMNECSQSNSNACSELLTKVKQNNIAIDDTLQESAHAANAIDTLQKKFQKTATHLRVLKDSASKKDVDNASTLFQQIDKHQNLLRKTLKGKRSSIKRDRNCKLSNEKSAITTDTYCRETNICCNEYMREIIEKWQKSRDEIEKSAEEYVHAQRIPKDNEKGGQQN